jgi:hypothetical protein
LAPTNQSQFAGVTLNAIGNTLTIIPSLLTQHLLCHRQYGRDTRTLLGTIGLSQAVAGSVVMS